MRAHLAALSLAIATACVAGPTTTAPATAGFPTPAQTPLMIGTLTLTDAACTLERRATALVPGPATLSVLNRTSGPIWADMGRIVAPGSYEEWARHVEFSAAEARAGRPMVGLYERAVRLGIVRDLSAGGSAAITGVLEPGVYAIVCLRVYAEIRELRPYAITGPLEVK